MPKSPTAMTLNRLRELGCFCDVVERWNGGVRRDLFGCIDIVAIDPIAKRLIGIQSTTNSNKSARIAKITAACAQEMRAWLATGARVEVWSWSRYKELLPDDRRSWRETVTPITREMLLCK